MKYWKPDAPESLTPRTRLSAFLDAEEQRIGAAFPTARRFALLEIARAVDRYWFYALGLRGHEADAEQSSVRAMLFENGWSVALRVFIDESACHPGTYTTRSCEETQRWADALVQYCGQIGVCRRMLELHRVGLIDLSGTSEHEYRFGVSGSRIGIEAVEREDTHYLSDLIRKADAPALTEVLRQRKTMLERLSDCVAPWQQHFIQYETSPELDEFYHLLGTLWARPLSGLGGEVFPLDATFGGLPYGMYRAACIRLACFAWKHLDCTQALLQKHPELDIRNLLTITSTKAGLAGYLAAALEIDTGSARQVLDALTLSLNNVSEHTLSSGGAAPPLIQIAEDAVVKWVFGMMNDSTQFLLAELRRRYPREWDGVVHRREQQFRNDLYRLFPGDHLIKAAHGFRLRADSRIVTDIDAMVLDTRIRTLGLFQLKWQDPYVSSMRKWQAKKTNFLAEGNAWVETVSAWLAENLPRTILRGLGIPGLNHLGVDRVLLFVIGRNFAHFSGESYPFRLEGYV